MLLITLINTVIKSLCLWQNKTIQFVEIAEKDEKEHFLWVKFIILYLRSIVIYINYCLGFFFSYTH
jgi:hypothetical protein